MTTECPRWFSPRQLLSTLVLASTLGCATIDRGVQDLLGPLDDDPAVAVQPTVPPDVPTFTVELRAANKPASTLPVALDRVLHVQDAVVKTGASENFRRMNVELFRPLENGRLHRLKVRYDRSTRRIDPAFDYALRPADRLVITEDTSTVLDDMLNTLGGPLGAGGG